MMATRLPLAGYLLYILCMAALPFLVFKAVSAAFPSLLDNLTFAVVWIAIFLPLMLKNFPWLALIAEFPISLPSSVHEMITTLVGLAGYLVCMTGLSCLVFIIANLVCKAASRSIHEDGIPPDWVVMTVLGAISMVIDMFISHSSHSTMMAMLFSLAGYLVYIVSIVALPYLIFRGAMSAFSVPKDFDGFVATMAIFLALALNNFSWLALISEFSSTFPSSVVEMIDTLVGLVGYLFCLMLLSFLVLLIVVFSWNMTLLPYCEESTNLTDMVEIGVTALLMDLFMKYSSHSNMMAMILFLAGYLVYILFIAGLLYLAFRGAMSVFQLEKESGAELFVALITISLLLALKNFQWPALLSEFPSSLPSSVPGIIATVAGLASYLVCMTGLSFLVITIAILIFQIALWPYPEKKTPEWIDMITFGITVVVMDMFMKHSSHSSMMTMLLFAGYLVYILCMMGLSYLVFQFLLFDDTIVPVLPSLLPIPLKYQRLVPMIVAGIILVLNDMHGLAPVEKPAFISESLSTFPSTVSGKLPGFLLYIVCMVALSFLGLIIAAGGICRIRIWWPMERPQLMLSTIIRLTFMLLNMIWGMPFQKVSSDSSMKAALVGLAGYLIYIMCSMAVSDMLSKSMMDAFFISLTFVLLDMFSILNIITTLFGLITMIAISVLTLFFLVAVSFVVSMGLHTWVETLLPSAVKNYHELTYVGIVGFSFKVMKIMLDIPVVEKLSILSNMKATLVDIADLRKDYHVVYLVIRYLTVLAIPCLFMELRYKMSTCKLHATAAIIIALGLVLTMPPSPPIQIKDLALQAMVLDDIIQRTVMSFVIHTVLIQATLIGGMAFYVRDQYPLWKMKITARYREFKKDAGQEAKSFVNHLLYKSTLGWFGKKNVYTSKRAPRR